jgi:hypothetical protein
MRVKNKPGAFLNWKPRFDPYIFYIFTYIFRNPVRLKPRFDPYKIL